MSSAKVGDEVQVHYTGELEDGTVFDTSHNADPLIFTIGKGQLIPGFEEAVIGMEPGESKKARIDSDKAYGPFRDEMVFEVNRAELPDSLQLEVGKQLQVHQADNVTFLLTP